MGLLEGLKFFLLGPPQVTWHDTVLDIPRRQVRILLYYLASYPNAVPQERLHYLLWNDKSEAVCRRNMSHLLTHARSILPDKDVLIIKDSLVMLDPQKIWCDVVEFKKFIRSTHKENRAEIFRQAVEYYRGPFLDGLQFSDEQEFENLIELERFHLERNFLNLLYKLILLQKQDGNYESAIEYAYQYLAKDNLSEEVHRQLILLFGLTGKRERALSQYKACEEVLQNELQTNPSMKTQLAYQHVLADSPLNENNMLIHESVEVRPAKIEPLFVNSASYNQLMNLLESNRSGQGGVAMLYGELGIGKSSLFTKALSKIGRDSLIVRAHCDPAVRSLPYWPVKNLLMKEFRSHPSTRAMIPEFLGSNPASAGMAQEIVESTATDAISKDKYFTLLVNSIVSLADEPGGLILCIEDLEWADTDTLELFLFLSRYTKSKKLWLLGSYCCPDHNHLIDFLHKLNLTEGLLGSVKVQCLGENEINLMVRFWIGDLKADQSFIRHLHHLSGGNPFFISEILRWITESGISATELMDNKSLTLPPTVSKTIMYRLGRLSRVERRVLEVAAVIGFSCKVDQISELSDLSVMQILDALDELVSRHFLSGKSTQYQFVHELVRQAVLDEMSSSRRQFLEESYLGQ